MNKVILLGRLTADPELRQTQSGIASCRFNMAVNRKYKNDKGEYEADFITCVAWRQTAEFVSRYFVKGQMIAVEGNLRSGSYQDKQHPDVTHYKTEVYVDAVEFAGGKNENGSRGSTEAAPAGQQAAQPMDYGNSSQFEEILSDGDCPF